MNFLSSLSSDSSKKHSELRGLISKKQNKQTKFVRFDIVYMNFANNELTIFGVLK